jgi:ABC-type multidrug transport system fused ATPase/permease subunit
MGGYGADSATLGEIHALLGKLGGKANELHGAINNTMRWLPLPESAVRKIQDLWNRFIAKWNEFWDMMDHIKSNMGAPSRLSDTADAWSREVGGPVSAKAQVGKTGSLAVDDNWDGDAADAYRQKLLLQEAPLDKMRSTFSEGISSALNTAALGIIAFWASLIGALAALIVGLVAAIAAAETVIGSIIAALLALVTAVGSINAGLLLLEGQMRSANTTLEQKLADNSGYLNQHWPPFVTG